MSSNYQLPFWVWPAALMTVCGLALFRGRNDERLAASSTLAAWALTLVASREFGSGPNNDTDWEVVPIDVALLGVYLWIVLRTRRYWPVVACGIWLLTVLTHFIRPPHPIVSGWTYKTVVIFWNYLVLIVIGYGAWTAPRYAGAGRDDAPTDAPCITPAELQIRGSTVRRSG